MFLESLDFGLDARQLQLLFALCLGVIFGIAAQISRFCLRRAIAGSASERGTASAVWVAALASAVIAIMVGRQLGYIDISEHRFFTNDIPVAAIILGGLAFGVGMVLTRGCVSRLTVLTATGNLRAMTVLTVFAIVAHATIKGVFAPLRVSLGSFTVPVGSGDLSQSPAFVWVAAAVALAGATVLIRQYKPALRDVILGAVIGLVPALGWAATSTLLFDEFDPLPLQSAAFTLPWSDSLFWVVASTAIPAGFGVGLIGGVLLGSFVSAAIRGELKLVSFENPRQTVRYISGAGLMGAGGVLAGGCTVGAGLSGAPALSVSALLALGAIIAGGVVARQFSALSPVAVPAE